MDYKLLMHICRACAWPSQPRKHLFHELLAAGLVSVSVVHQVVGGIYIPIQDRPA